MNEASGRAMIAMTDAMDACYRRQSRWYREAFAEAHAELWVMGAIDWAILVKYL